MKLKNTIGTAENKYLGRWPVLAICGNELQIRLRGKTQWVSRAEWHLVG